MPLRANTNINIRPIPLVSRNPRSACQNQQGKEKSRCETVHTFRCNSTPYEWECELGSGPDEAKITRKLEAGYAYAGSVPVHSSNGDLPTAEDGKRHLSSRIPER